MKSSNSELSPQLNSSIPGDTTQSVKDRSVAGHLALEVMHEIANSLDGLGNLVHLAFEEAQEPRVREYMRLAKEQVLIIHGITHQTLGYARTVSAPKPSDLVALAGAALRIHQRTIEAKRIHLIRRHPEEVVLAIHTGEILQVVSNLIANALDALQNDGTLNIRLRKAPNGVHLLISDNGHGIPPVHASRIFEPFFSTKEDRGTGLGLAISKRIIEAHGGRISVRSSVRPGNRGTTFRISLPAQVS